MVPECIVVFFSGANTNRGRPGWSVRTIEKCCYDYKTLAEWRKRFKNNKDTPTEELNLIIAICRAYNEPDTTDKIQSPNVQRD